MAIDLSGLELEWSHDHECERERWTASACYGAGDEIVLHAQSDGFWLRAGSFYMELDVNGLRQSMQMAERFVAIVDTVEELAKQSDFIVADPPSAQIIDLFEALKNVENKP